MQRRYDLTQGKSGQHLFFKNTRFSPDGTCLLSATSDNRYLIHALPVDLYSATGDDEQRRVDDISEQRWDACLEIKESENIYEYSWFPGMNSHDVATCCFISASRDSPVKLRDAYNGMVRCTYSCIDQNDEVAAPATVRFNLAGTRIYAGLENYVVSFDINRPGRDGDKISTTPTRKSKQGQKGLISHIAFNRDYSGMFAACSYSGSLGIYHEETGELLWNVHHPNSSFTQVEFSNDGKYLFSACRKDDSVACWDIRNTATILRTIRRSGNTNQRLYFDIHPTECKFACGDLDGFVRVCDISDAAIQEDREETSTARETIKCHQDAISGCSFHPYLPYVATCSGQRTFRDYEDDDDEVPVTAREFTSESSLKIWKLAGNK